jgi:hypothetical protein
MGSGFSQKIFPEIEGVTLDEKAVSLPFRNSKYSVIGVAFSRKAEDELKRWSNLIYEVFVKKEKTKDPFDMAEIYDVNFIFIPLISVFRKFSGEFKKRSDEHYWPYIMNPERGGVKQLKSELLVADKDIPYFYVTDPQGVIVARQEGSYSENKMESLESAVK